MIIVKMQQVTDAYGETVGYSIVFSDEERRKIEDAFRDEMKNLPTPEQVQSLHRHREELETRHRERIAMLSQVHT